ncbi:MAG: hypothetical protein RLZZ163_919 [Actinomycetota bacterium]
MPAGGGRTTLPRMSDRWVDLQEAIPVQAYAVDMMTVVTEDGVGNACYLRFVTTDDDGEHEVMSFVLDPDVAALMGWEIAGAAHGHLDRLITERIPDNEALEELARRLGFLGEDYD